MKTLFDAQIDGLAQYCVNSMGDIFWDHVDERDAAMDFTDPQEVAVEAVATTLHKFAASIESNPVYPLSLRLEYREIVARVGEAAEDARIISTLIIDAGWTAEGARTVLRLARIYGTSILRNALALAEAMDIEDGEAGL